MKPTKLFFLVLILGLFGAVFYFDLHHFLTLETVKGYQATVDRIYRDAPLLVAGAYVASYVLSAAISIPGATVLTLMGGAIFGAWVAMILVAVGATLGASLAFLCARFIFRDALESKYANRLAVFNKELEKNAFQYMLFLRLVPLFPFFLINLVMGLTRVSLKVFFIASFVGMIPGILVYSNAGEQLGSIESLKDVASPKVLLAFVLLGCFALVPVIYKKYKKRRGV